jgi:RluA family pseudouridine synthase
MNQNIVYQDADVLVLNKPAGLLSQKDKSGDEDVTGALKKILPNIPFIAPVHRLDRNTSGLLLVALNAKSASALTESIKAGKVHRVYLAIVKGDPGEKGRIDLPLRKEEYSNEVFVDADDGKKAVTLFKRIKKMGATSLLEVELETGRSHQIRAHFAHLKCALIGDKKYAKKPWSIIFGRPALHATSITFPHPTTGKSMSFIADPPEDFHNLFKTLLKGVEK